jgi:hypothetical protein
MNSRWRGSWSTVRLGPNAEKVNTMVRKALSALILICPDERIQVIFNFVFEKGCDKLDRLLLFFNTVGLKFRIIEKLNKIVTMEIQQRHHKLLYLISTNHKIYFDWSSEICVPTAGIPASKWPLSTSRTVVNWFLNR